MPPAYDIWVSKALASQLGRHPLFDLAVQSLVYHNVLGGLGFAVALFLFWMESQRPENSEGVSVSVWTIFLTSMFVAILSVVASSAFHWLPPYRNPALWRLYPDYMDRNENSSSFLSQSTAVYAAMAMGFYALNRKVGLAFWIAVVAAVALPRMYVGGHYPTDIIAGLIVGVGGYMIGRRIFSPTLAPYLERTSRRVRSFRILVSVMAFLWIVEVAVEFRDLVWIRRVLAYYLKI